MQNMAALKVFTLLLVAFISSVSASYKLSSPNDAHYCYIQWLHPPKTASTFCLSLQHACSESQFLEHAEAHTRVRINFGCPILEPQGTWYGSRYHAPLYPPDVAQLKRFATVLRNPDERLISAFADNMHMEGLNKTAKEELYGQLIGGNRGNFAGDTETCLSNFEKYANYRRGNRGCYVKMLNEHECHSDVAVTPEMVEVAKKRLEEFLFVGIFEEYETSINVFFRVAEKIMDASKFAVNVKANETDVFKLKHELQPPHAIELKALRKTKNPCLHPLQKHYRESHKNDVPEVPNSLAAQRVYDDKVDGEIYEFAKKLFEKKRKEMGVEYPVKRIEPPARRNKHV